MDGDYEYLLKLCRAGKLYEAEALLRDGVDPNPPPGVRKSALGVAMEKGFHSLVVLLLRSGARPGQREVENAAYAGNLEHLRLLLEHGGKLGCVYAIRAACERGGGAMIDFLLAQGVDLVTGSPLAVAMKTGNKSAIGKWKRLLDQHPTLAVQGAMALAHFCREGSERGVALMLWAGADPRMPIPEEGHEDDPERHKTALEEAAEGGRVKILQRLAIDPATDDVGYLMYRADSRDRAEAVECLFDRCTPAQREAGLKQMLELAIWRVDWKSDRTLSSGCGPYAARGEVEKIERLARMGAKSDARAESGSIRSALRRVEPELAMRVIRALASGPVPDLDELRRIVKTKTILGRLESLSLSREDRELLALRPSKGDAARHGTRDLGYATPRKPWWPQQSFWQRRNKATP